jgi:hypothetical protein
MISLSFDLSAFERKAQEIGGAIDQIPFALSTALNEAAFNTRQVLVQQTWPSHMSVRNPSFIGAALRVEKATKQTLAVAISDTGPAGGRANLSLHAKGGTKTARGNLAIPDSKLKSRRTGRGVPKGLRPTALPNSFKRGDVIYQRVGKKGRDGLKLMYTLKPSAPIRADVPFEQDFVASMRNVMRTAFPAAMARAMKSRKR